jgi:septal ring factor EnvC (AmiA/AmiB activator)
MATIEERIGTLEMRMNNLETWAGPGQAAALAEGQRQIRADLAKMQAEFAGFKTEFASFKAEFAGFKTEFASFKAEFAGFKTEVKADMAEVKGTLREILRRLPAPPAEA